MAPATLDRDDTDILADGTFTISGAVAFCGLCRTTLYAAMNNGELAWVKVPGTRARRIPRRALKEFLRRGLVNGDNQDSNQ